MHKSLSIEIKSDIYIVEKHANILGQSTQRQVKRKKRAQNIDISLGNVYNVYNMMK